ncbi:Sec23/Sec24 zinc finger-containing protein [Trichococcus paludicola]|uniref:Sec23/Sec24 zinc finger-containing protein n=1 Tax=Trichococcus paludicola TaxID=2052942 RepID=UPI000D3A8ED5|nr:Sec23/Sec24 zinc finger-containing protein [Trichococcus paludicola]
MIERFPDVDWYCDKCGSSLNNQDGFNDHKYLWKCTECGFKSSISKDNIRCEDEEDEED